MFCAPDILTNKEFMEYGEPILPAGYFFARVGVTSLAQGMPEVEKEIKEPEMRQRMMKINLQHMSTLKFGKMCF